LQWLPSRLATHCGSPHLYDSQWVGEGRSDPPRPATVEEWLGLMSAWHRLLHDGNPEGRSKNWPIAPPSIWKFSESFDLPLGDWAIENAKIHGWTDMLALSETQAVRHRYLASLTSEARLELFRVERWMRRLAQDRDWALNGWVQTGSGAWHWRRRLLKS
jgi:hypothetical protein